MAFSTVGVPGVRTRLLASALVAAMLLVESAWGEIFTNVLDPRHPSFSERTELDDTVVVVVNTARGDPPSVRRKVRRTKVPIPCVGKGKGAKATTARLLKSDAVSVCVEYGAGMLKLRSRRARSDSLVEWIPVRLSEMPRSSIERTRLVQVDGSTLLEFELHERSGADEGALDDRSMIVIDPVRERYLLNVMRSHDAEGSRDGENFTESCKGVARLAGDRFHLGGYGCHEETESETESGELTSYTRTTSPDPEYVYRYRNGFLHRER